ncbi:hypothetical protein SAY87_008069 [Trapa incisa]|uniref:Uncharacterized protein n=1 Tax=Trapa incisa TaxID=236973 RepID=A0AAN7QFP4_9MYRT|nr:hypothetical protein SAY87_008069 [Trapa incisa]
MKPISRRDRQKRVDLVSAGRTSMASGMDWLWPTGPSSSSPPSLSLLLAPAACIPAYLTATVRPADIHRRSTSGPWWSTWALTRTPWGAT